MERDLRAVNTYFTFHTYVRDPIAEGGGRERPRTPLPSLPTAQAAETRKRSGGRLGGLRGFFIS
eukprot:scaffold238264_cov44-Tisochrysis_lutea.AAC.1